jgi:hypothetical protein
VDHYRAVVKEACGSRKCLLYLVVQRVAPSQQEVFSTELISPVNKLLTFTGVIFGSRFLKYYPFLFSESKYRLTAYLKQNKKVISKLLLKKKHFTKRISNSRKSDLLCD